MKIRLQRNISSLLLLLFCIMLAFFLGLKTGKFFDPVNLINISEANSYRILLAIAMMVVIVTGGIDLSIGSILSLSAIIVASLLQTGWTVPFSVAMALLSGTALGAINGAIISFSRINAFIITLSTSFLFRGMSLIITKGIPITKLPSAFRRFASGKSLGMENGVFFALISVVLLALFFYKTRWGHYIATLGGNEEALRRSGINTKAYRLSVFALSGFFAALAGIIITGRLNSAEANAGLNMEMDAICAVIMGGTLLRGGKGNLPGTVIAVFLLGMIRNALTLLSISSYYQQFITGAILLTAVLLAEFRERKNRVAG